MRYAATGSERQRADVAIVGGGVMGCALAYFLARGGTKVVVLEQGAIGGVPSASGASLAMIDFAVGGADPIAQQAVLTHELLPELSAELLARTGIDIQLSQPGLLRLAHDGDEAAALAGVIARYRELGQAAEWLDGRAVREAQSGLSPDVVGAAYCPGALGVYAPRYVRALAGGAAAHGAVIRQGVPVVGFRRRGDRVAAVLTSEGAIEAGQVVLATGAWTGIVGAWLGQALPVGPQRGQLMALQPRPPAPVLRRWLYDGGSAGGLAPKPDGTVVVGATRESVGWDGRNTAGGVGFLASLAHRLLPSLAEATVKHIWYGFRPMRTDGGPPLIGPLPGLANVGVIAGHGAIGITLSAAVGHLAAQWLNGRQPALSLAPFDPARNSVGAADDCQQER
jgi:glycine oxidase